MSFKFDYRALGRLRAGQMNKTEAKYAQHLELLKRANKLKWYMFEGLTLRLADRTTYRPDFVVLNENNELECREVKGWMLDDANVKLKVAAETFPFRFILVKWVKGQWEEKEI